MPKKVDADVESAIEWLKEHSTRATLNGMARYGLPSDKAFGVAVKDIQALGKVIGRNHDLALALWETGWYEARMLTSFIADPAQLTESKMDRWCKDFDNWGICDTLCFHLFDRSPHAWAKVKQWSEREAEFEKRAGFALLACLAGHDKKAGDDRFREGLKLIEAAASDDRNFVKKALVWALRRIATRNAKLHKASAEVAERLAKSPDVSARWTGRTALRELSKTEARAGESSRAATKRSKP